MEQKIFQRSTLIQVIKIFKILVIVLVLFLLVSCKSKYPKPTDEYYVNDFAEALHPVTKRVVTLEGERLYDETKNIKTIGGAQIVVATFLVDSFNDIATYDRTEIFRQWKIGKNDMGVLLLLFFSIVEDEGVEYFYLEKAEFEVGYRMEQYFTAGVQGRLLDDTLFNPEVFDLDIGVALIEYELLTIMYEEVYKDEYGSFSYDIENFIDAMDNYVYQEEEPVNWFMMVIAVLANNWYIVAIVGFGMLGGGILVSKNKGGGGSSGGYGVFRK